jgi:hypothetical protein
VLLFDACAVRAKRIERFWDKGKSDKNTITLNDTRDGGEATNESKVVPGGTVGITK